MAAGGRQISGRQILGRQDGPRWNLTVELQSLKPGCKSRINPWKGLRPSRPMWRTFIWLIAPLHLFYIHPPFPSWFFSTTVPTFEWWLRFSLLFCMLTISMRPSILSPKKPLSQPHQERDHLTSGGGPLSPPLWAESCFVLNKSLVRPPHTLVVSIISFSWRQDRNSGLRGMQVPGQQ